MTDDLINALKKEQREDADTIEALRAENAKLRDINRWNIERDGDDVYICENNHAKGDKCEYERWYPRAHVEALRAENARLREALKPFADEVEWLDSKYDCNESHYAGGIKCGHIRAARDALIK